MGSIDADAQSFDVLILGAGLSGLCALHHVRTRFPQWRIKVLEAAPSVGGTWYYNCYPGARVDTESLSYAFSFDEDIINEWDWKDTFSTQADTLKYIEFVARKKDLLRDIQLNTRVKLAQWQGSSRTWLLKDEEGRQYQARFLISCIGFLSSPTLPSVSGIDSFTGPSYHTSRWPRNFDMKRDFGGKRIGVIGTGATGIQVATATAKEPTIMSLTVFQRTANWSAPLRSEAITPEQMSLIKKDYGRIWEQCADTPAGFLAKPDPRKSLEVTEQERLSLWEKLYSEPGFGKWIGVFSDTYTDRRANDLYSHFMAEKIRALISDPEVADSLVPKDHGFGTRRVPLNSGYFEIYNQPNVRLVDLKKTPVERITPRGIATSDGQEHVLDVLVFATGFNAITGAFSEIDWHAREDRPLLGYSESPGGEGKEAIWVDHRPRTFLGMTTLNMPNMFMVLGPHQPFGNAPRSIEHAVGFITDLLQHCNENGYTFVEPTEAAVDGWTEHVVDCGKGALANEVDSWITGVNTNVKGKSVRSVARYTGHAKEYKKRCESCKEGGWKGLIFE